MLAKLQRSKIQFLAVVTAILVLAGVAGQAQDGYISARSFAESQGIAYQWFPIQRILVMRQGLKTVRLTVDNTTAIVNDSEIQMAAPAKIQQGQIMVPAAALNRFFLPSEGTAALKTAAPQILVQQTSQPPSQPIIGQPIAITQAPSVAPKQVAITTATQANDEAILVALRHSVREDHTRIVLEFNDIITYQTEFKDGLYRLSISGCRNLVPTQRSNPEGRDIKKLDINSGPDRKGLILSFYLNQRDKTPTIETVGGPFRMIISFAASNEQQLATAPATLVASAPLATSAAAPQSAKATETTKMETAPEINIEVTAASLNKQEFRGRTIIIDPGHGGTDKGFVFEGRPEEKLINLAIAQHLKACLETSGLKAILTRTSDVDISSSQRLGIANRHGGDLYISLHLGGSSDTTKAGIACYSYGKKGTFVDESAQGLSYDAVYHEWLKNTRFDLSVFLARKANERLIQHIKVESRGVKELPLLPLQFITIPAVVVETGMLSDPTEGKNLISDKYRKAVAQSIANAVIDFFNGIVINQ
ncbi:MAG: N-acetylmuramoyl-L-alanine amidase [Candidatus Riflebacteria bacterium]|nr:N-acetylmuramoyl-L-alanine amidase [Candidatus Riflebacteria bacterium]